MSENGPLPDDQLTSFWLETCPIPSFASLKEDRQADVTVVGGGISGVLTAYRLAKEGVKVALLEANQLLHGTTGHTTAKVTAQHGLIYDEFIQHFGIEKTKQYVDSNFEAMNWIKDMIKTDQIECDYQEQDAIIYATTKKTEERLKKEYEAYQKLGIECEWLTALPIRVPVIAALNMKNQMQFHPIKFLVHMIQEIKKFGGLIFENTVVKSVETKPSIKVKTQSGFEMASDKVVFCTHYPYFVKGQYFAKLFPYRSYLVATKVSEEYPGGMYWTPDDGTRSIRSTTHAGNTVVFFGGDGHKAGQDDAHRMHYDNLLDFGNTVFDIQEEYQSWSAQDLESLDKLPYIGLVKSNQDNLYIETGYRKWGMTLSTVASKIISDLILKRDNPYKDLYSPERFYADPSIKKIIKENANVAAELIKGKMPKKTITIDELQPGEGANVVINGEKCGAYKDKDGQVSIVDTTCTHLKCEVKWNNHDKTWDCPCHGSRFSPYGDVIEGPAKKPLNKK
ncbi:FAD-dependent oxidoreductase [Terrilactibacillus sp. BCM23-1]|uniref:FAD-dependent oxidoreductase n=1 Tax=Terrilactibacillus tamarindi TaxID=2599694 RepID=A0A6N8CT37_9BACI|nr:FAD-dependent oxidoreductase [Terrilactibacillus tamarindi]MTT32105.1 FAD-dependent oxidoreductase [Terrilactibacillus tamarindi]